MANQKPNTVATPNPESNKVVQMEKGPQSAKALYGLNAGNVAYYGVKPANDDNKK